MQKMGIFRARLRGCDVALEATWLCHVDTRGCLRGTDVTHYSYIGYCTYMPPIEDITNCYITTYLIYPSSLLHFLRVGLKSHQFNICRRGGSFSCVRSTSRRIKCVDAVDAVDTRSTRSTYRARGIKLT